MGLTTLQQRLGYSFSNAGYLKQALTHKSAHTRHYERLEFLGDSILNYGISSLIFQTCHHLDEGKLSILRSRLVSKPSLSKLGKRLALDPYIRTQNQVVSDAIRADVMEAIIGAIYLDGGIQACESMIKTHFFPLVQELASQNLKDPKSHLQELAHQLGKPRPQYAILEESGQSHDITYTIVCKLDGLSTQGTSGIKRHAEKLAAEKMLTQLKADSYE